MRARVSVPCIAVLRCRFTHREGAVIEAGAKHAVGGVPEILLVAALDHRRRDRAQRWRDSGGEHDVRRLLHRSEYIDKVKARTKAYEVLGEANNLRDYSDEERRYENEKGREGRRGPR